MISRRITKQMAGSSWIRRMFEEGIRLKAKHGPENVCDFSLGNPLLEPPPEFREELIKLAQTSAAGLHRYMPNGGFSDARSAIADRLSQDTGLAFSAEHVLFTSGAGGAINVALRSLLDPGDEVIIFAPYFAEYIFYIQHHGGKARVAHCGKSFLPDRESLSSCLTARTKAVLLNSPNNPTGVVYPTETIAEICKEIQLAEERHGTKIYLISDEAYRRLTFDSMVPPHVFRHHVRSIVAASHSKDLGLAGERIGYLAMNPLWDEANEFTDAAIFALRTLGFVNAPAIMQRLVAKIQGASVDVSEYESKRDFLYRELTGMGYECVKPTGAFYMFPKSPIQDDLKFMSILQSMLVLTTPGVGFGTPGHFRIAFSVEDDVLDRSLVAFQAGLEQALSAG